MHESLFYRGKPVMFGPDPCEPCSGNGLLGSGVGQTEIVAPATAPASPWALALTTSVVGAATGWAIQEISRAVRGRQRR